MHIASQFQILANRVGPDFDFPEVNTIPSHDSYFDTLANQTIRALRCPGHSKKGCVIIEAISPNFSDEEIETRTRDKKPLKISDTFVSAILTLLVLNSN